MKNLLIVLCFSTVLSACGQKAVSEHLNAANQAIEHQDYDTAVIELKNAVRIEPNNAHSRFLLGETYLKLRQYAPAEKELERALELGYEVNAVIPLLSNVYHRQGENKRLFELTAEAKGLKPRELAQLKFNQLQTHVNLGNKAKAKALISELKEIINGAEYSQLALVYDLILDQQLEGALLQLKNIIATYPFQREALKLQANLYLSNNQPLLAAETYQNYVTAYPEEIEIKLVLARMYSELNLDNKAEPLVDELLKGYPDFPLLIQLKASAQLKQKNFQNALTLADKALSLNPEDSASRLIAGVGAYFTQDYKTSQYHLALIAGLLKPQHPALRLLADSQLKLGMSLQANETVQRFEAISEQDVSILSGVGLELIHLGERAKAQAILTKSQHDQQLTSPVTLANLAALKFSLDDASGILDLEKALKNTKTGESPLSEKELELHLAHALFSTKQYDKAFDLATKWQQREGLEDKLKGLVIAAKIHIKQGDNELAKQTYEKALSLKPNDRAIQLELIKLSPLDNPESIQVALNKVRALLEQHPTYLPAILQHYLLSRTIQKPEQVTAHLEKLIEKYQAENDHVAVTNLRIVLGKIWFLEGKPADSIKILELVKETDNTKAKHYWSQLAQAYVQTKQFDDAKKLYQQWYEQEPNQTRAILGMIKVYSVQGQVDKALSLSDRYLKELGGKNPEIQLLKLHLLAKTQQYNKLDEELKKLPEHIHALTFVQGLTGQVLLAQQAPQQAEPKLRLAYQATPSPTHVSLLLSAIYQNRGEQEALEFLKSHVEQYPTDQTSTLRYAQLLSDKHPDQAKIYYKKIIEHNKNHFIAHNNLANLLLKNNNLELAYIHAAEANALKPNEGQILHTMGRIELQLGRHKDALAHISAAVNLLKDELTDEVKVNHIEALVLNNEKKLAKRKIEQYTLTDKLQLTRLKNLREIHRL